MKNSSGIVPRQQGGISFEIELEKEYYWAKNALVKLLPFESKSDRSRYHCTLIWNDGRPFGARWFDAGEILQRPENE